MKINFDQPLYLLALIPFIALLLLPFILRNRKKRTNGRRIAALVARLLAAVMLVSALAGLCVSKVTDKTSVMIVADLSDSTRTVESEFEEYIKKIASYSSDDTEIGLLTFGYTSEYELPLSDDMNFKVFETDPAGNYTDIYSAVIKAAAFLPENTNKRIILLTDGKENINNIKEAATVLASGKIRLDAVVLDTTPVSREIQLTSVEVPDVIYEGEEFKLTVIIESNQDCKATLTLEEDGVSVSRNEISLTKGTNRFVFKRTAAATGISTYTAKISTDEDGLAGNNTVYSFINVLGTPKILIIDGSGTEAHELEGLLGDSVKVESCPAATAPDNIADLRKYQAVVMMNVKKSDLPDGWDEIAEAYVKQLGRGLLYVGGSQSFILGDWEGSVLEEILPVDMTVKDEYYLPDSAIMTLIDNSGSMSGNPLELAKQGAINAAETVRDNDQLGVIAFSDNAVWLSKLTKGSDRAEVQKKIASINVGGGTMLKTALEESLTALKESGCGTKNIILLTDGYPGDEDAILSSNLITRLAEAEITVSCIAVGAGSNTELLTKLASGTGGTVTEVLDEQDIPKIIYDQTVKAMLGSYLCNESFSPTVKDYTQVLEGVGTLPDLDGFVMTEAKSLAYTVLQAKEEKPLLAVWQYGLGKTAAFTSDLNGKWSSALLASEDGQQLIRNLISWLLPGTDTEGNGSVTVERSGDKGIITLISQETEGGTAEATVISPSGKESTVALTPGGVSSYTGSFFLEEEGSYVTVVTQKDENGNTVLSKEAAMAVRYSDEYDMFATDNGYVAECCIATGGNALWTDIAELMKVKLSGAESQTDLGNALLIISVFLVMLDIALRRLGIDFTELAKKLRKKLAKNGAVTETAEGEVYVPAAAAKKARSKANDTEKKAPLEKEEEYKPAKAVKKKKAAPKPGKREADQNVTAASGIASLLKDVDNNKRHKL